jgi:hypothetical protein
MRPLIKFEAYSREEVHDIFAPDTQFQIQRGTWGIHGIVPIPGRAGDFVFFVTYGQEQGDYIFDEGITEDGVLTWQSQPRQSLDNPQIQEFIHHDELKNSIYLFLRTKKRIPYTYLGRLKYLTHDKEREKPVHFQWQILDWDIPKEVLDRMGLVLELSVQAPKDAVNVGTLVKTEIPTIDYKQGVPKATFQARRIPDFSEIETKRREIGVGGEQLVVEHERALLAAQRRDDLARKVRHISIEEGDGAGYDILSFTAEGDEKYIEVKTTKGPAHTPFYMTSNEVEFARTHREKYYLCRVHEYDIESNSGKVFVVEGEIDRTFTFTATEFRVTIG